MKTPLKQIAKTVLTALHLDITKGMKYDRQTLRVMKQVLTPASNCIDIGANKGDILALIKKLSPLGNHFAFEPLPHLYAELRQKYSGDDKVHINNTALSDERGTAEFVHVVNAPGYSGFKQRSYSVAQPELRKIQVQTDLLDAIIPATQYIDFIKIDVEGAELAVMHGAVKTIRRCKPVMVFECGLGGSDYYGTTADDMYGFICTDCGLKLSTLQGFLDAQPALSAVQFREHFRTNSEYYFIAYP